MTALTKYARLEATGLWRASPDDQRREVVASIGDATLMITDLTDQALAHWSLAAVNRSNSTDYPAVFHPDGDPGETLELPEAEAEMIEAIETLRRAVEKTRPHPGRLRWLGVLASVSAVAAVGFFWVPGALIDHAISVVPDVKRAEIGTALLARIERLSGAPCADSAGKRALATLSGRLDAGTLTILPDGIATSLSLPGNHTLLNRALVEDFEEPDVIAGYALAEATLRRSSDPLRDLLSVSGAWASFRLLTTGNLESSILDSYAEFLLKTPRPIPDSVALLETFQAAELRSTPYAYARDVTGETVLDLIEGDPMAGQPPAPLLSDSDWLRLQSICGG
ncbi:MAG: hypothetical protein WBC93_20455 [Sulfitobacter sp.]